MVRVCFQLNGIIQVPGANSHCWAVCWNLCRIQGVLKLLMACQVRQMATWPAVLVSGLVSVILAFVILALSSWMFKESIKLLGIFVGSDLILTSLALLLIAFMARLGMFSFQDSQKLEKCFLRFIFLILREYAIFFAFTHTQRLNILILHLEIYLEMEKCSCRSQGQGDSSTTFGTKWACVIVDRPVRTPSNESLCRGFEGACRGIRSVQCMKYVFLVSKCTSCSILKVGITRFKCNHPSWVFRVCMLISTALF